MSRVSGEAGSVTAEVVLVTPIAIALLCLVALVGRTATAREQVDEAARDAARSASLERDPFSAEDAAMEAAHRSLDGGGFSCATSTVAVDLAAFYPGGQVRVTVSCDIALSDLGLLGIPATTRSESIAVSVIDQYRAQP